MSETDTYYRYKHDRVLLGVDQIFRPTASASVIQLTGAQVEMLRNMTQYLNRPNTYVWEYEVAKYLTPSDEHFDDIQAIVANLEEKLMGNENVLWGYKDRWSEQLDTTTDGSGYVNVSTDPVPSGYVYVAQAVSAVIIGDAVTNVDISVVDGSDNTVLAFASALAAAVWLSWTGSITLKEGDTIKIYMGDAASGKVFRGRVHGYKMVVPE